MDELGWVFAGSDIYGAVESWVGVRRPGGYFGLGTIRAVAECAITLMYSCVRVLMPRFLHFIFNHVRLKSKDDTLAFSG